MLIKIFLECNSDQKLCKDGAYMIFIELSVEANQFYKWHFLFIINKKIIVKSSAVFWVRKTSTNKTRGKDIHVESDIILSAATAEF